MLDCSGEGKDGEGEREGPGSGGNSRVQDLIGAQKLTLEIEEPGEREREAAPRMTLASIDETMRECAATIDSALSLSTQHPTPESLGARVQVCASPLSAEGYGLPPELLQALKFREVPTVEEAQEVGERKRMQKVIDAWLDVAEALQRQAAVSEELSARRQRRDALLALSMWREAMDEEDSDEGERAAGSVATALRGGGERGKKGTESVVWSPATEGEGKEAPWPAPAVQAVQSEDSVSTLGGGIHPSRSVCSEESFSTDVRLGPSMPFLHGGISKGEGPSGDAVSVASEASTGTSTSEPSATTVLFEWGANMAGGVPAMMGAMAGRDRKSVV